MNQPNLIYVFPDEFRPTALGYRGIEKVKTPHLDKFASRGTTLTKAVSNFPVCSPYRAMLFTGKYPYKNGVITNCRSTAPDEIQLDDDEYCLSDALAGQGYDLGYIGKLHLRKPTEADAVYGEGARGDGTVWDAWQPPGKARHGFNFWHSYGCCDNHLAPHYWTGDNPIDKKLEPGKWSVIHETDVAVDYLRNTAGQRDPEKPFALFVAHNPPHMPFNEVPHEYVELYNDVKSEDLLDWENLTEEGRERALPHVRNYFAMISGVDEQFGRLMETLETEGLADDTIVIFTSDHGEMMGSHGLMGKSVWYNESVHVPFIIRWPGKIEAGAQSELLLSAVDLMPTLLSLLGCGGAMPGDREGIDLSAQLLGMKEGYPESAFYILPPEDARGVITTDYTFVGKLADGGTEWHCYDNREDPRQLRNLYGRNPTRDNRFREMLETWLEKTDDPLKGCFGGVISETDR